MRAGIIAEGRADLAVLRNVLEGWLGVERDEVRFLVPEYDLDATDRHAMASEQRSNWLRVRDECHSGERVREFLALHADDAPIVVVQIDAAEAAEPGYDVTRPDRAAADSGELLRARVLACVDAWLPEDVRPRVRHAIAVEETDAWVLALFVTKDTAALPRPKETLERELNRPGSPVERDRKRFFQLDVFTQYDRLTRDLRKRKTLVACASRNASLRAFLDELSPPLDGVAPVG
jgi:hypothetical protein